MNEMLCQAITDRRLLKMEYTEGDRLVEVYVYGRDKEGEEWVRAYQVSGHSVSGETEGWKLFRAAEIGDLILTEQTFTESRAEYNTHDPVITTIYCQVT